MFKIHNVSIENFRGIKEKKSFDFENQRFILLSASNGMGKTTLLDAIEWCLTGNIGRLKKAYVLRSPNDEERNINVKGILKNKNALENEAVIVELTISVSDEIHTITRRQYADTLTPDSYILEISNVEDPEKWLTAKIGNSYYNHHFCDVQKAIGLLSEKRNNLSELFDDFISDYTEQENIVIQLKRFEKYINNIISDLKTEIKNKKIELGYAQNNLKNSRDVSIFDDYPIEKIYDEEEINLLDKDLHFLTEQQKCFNNIGQVQASDYLKQYLYYKKLMLVKDKIIELQICYDEKNNEISESLKSELYKNELINNVDEEIQNLKNIIIEKQNIIVFGEYLSQYNDADFTPHDYQELNKKYSSLQDNILKYEKEIDHLSKGNDILKQFTSLIESKRIYLEYRDTILKNSDIVKCPLCGSKDFGLIDKNNLFDEAEKYIDNNNAIVKSYSEKLREIKQEFESLILHYVNKANRAKFNVIERLIIKRNHLVDLKNSTEQFYELVNYINRKIGINESYINWANPDYICSKLEEIKTELEKLGNIEEIKNAAFEILDVISYKYDESYSEEQIVAGLEGITTNISIINFNKDYFIKKYNLLSQMIIHQKYVSMNENEIKLSEELNMLSERKQEFDNDSKIAHQLIDSINDIINKAKEQEYNFVGKEVYGFYRKLSRVNTIKEININIEGKSNSVNISDDTQKSIVNVLSSGQLSVFLMAFFLSGIFVRAKNEICKIYFIDDITACMDDINMLSFLDLLKYLMRNNQTIDQLFFSSCDERICSLIRYKMSGCGIGICDLNEEKFSLKSGV